MGVKATDFGSILIEQHVGFKGELRFPETFLPTKQVGAGNFGRVANDKFGHSVTIDGMLAAVGVPSQDYNELGEASAADAGAVFVYRRSYDSWEFAYKIVAPEGSRASADNFGYSVSLKGSKLIVGAPAHALNAAQNNPVVGAGAAFIYEITQTEATLETKVAPEVRDVNDNFGFTVHMHDNFAYVGSYMHGRNELNQLDAAEAGAIWVYQYVPGTSTWVQAKKIVAGGNDRSVNDEFGSTVSSHKNILAVGVPNYSYLTKGTDLKTNAGAVYVFDWKVDRWVYRTLLVAPDRTERDNFGSAVAVYDKRIVIGAAGKNDGKGKAYVFAQDELGNYSFVQSVEPAIRPLPESYVQPTSDTLLNNAGFGSSVSLTENTLAIGAPSQRGLHLTNVNTSVTPHTWVGVEQANTGHAYVYEVAEDNTLTLVNQLTSFDRFGSLTKPNEDGQFGFSVSVGANAIVIGEPTANVGSAGTDYKTNAGTAHIYERVEGSFVYSKTIEGFYMDRNAQDRFASDFASTDRFMAFGAPGQDYDSNSENYLVSSGAVYLWENEGGSWKFRQKITPSDRTENHAFGTKVEVLNDRVFVQALEANGSGSVYVFAYDNGVFVEKQKIAHVSVVANDNFGATILPKDNWLFITAIGKTVNSNTNHGSVYAYAYDAETGKYVFDAIVLPSIMNANARFGGSLAFSDNLLVVGSRGHTTDRSDSDPLTDAGAVFVFTNVESAWTQVAKVTGPGSERQASDYMGFSVSSYGNKVAVGIPGADYDLNLSARLNNAGKVTVFEHDGQGWKSAGAVVSPSRVAGGRFGTAVALGQDRLVVAAGGETNYTVNTYGWGSGFVYVYTFELGEWKLEATLQNVNASSQKAQRFGYCLALDGNILAIGEPVNAMPNVGSTELLEAGAAYVYEYVGSEWKRTARVTAEDLGGRTATANFGASIDVKGNLLVVGAPEETKNEEGGAVVSRAGAAYLFRRTENQNTIVWNPEKKIAGWVQDRNASDRFGDGLAAFGDYVVVGAPGHDYDMNRENFLDNAGALFVYEWVDNALVYRQKLTPHSNADRAADKGFGSVIAMSGTHIFASAKDYRPSGSSAGRVWSWKLENGYWVKEQVFASLNNYNVSASGSFGASIATDNDLLVVGNPTLPYNQSGNFLGNSGNVDVWRFVNGKWNVEQSLYAEFREADDAFGSSVAVQNEVIVVGGPASNSSTSTIDSNDGRSTSGGAAWIFHKVNNSWKNTQKLIRGAGDMPVAANFGTSASMDGNTLVVGAPDYGYDLDVKSYVHRAGAAYVFTMTENSGWQFERILTSPNRATGEVFGTDVVVRGDMIWVGAPGTSINGTVYGSVYGFRRSGGSDVRRVRRFARYKPTGANQSFIVPPNTTEVNFYMWGASGSQGNTSGTGMGGNGGFVRVKVPTVPGETLTLAVGTAPASNTGGGGGGRSEILRGASTLAVAAGGGGMSSSSTGGYSNIGSGGHGGGLEGAQGVIGEEGVVAGMGATQTAGGRAHTFARYSNGEGGLFKRGGNAPNIGTRAPGGWPNGGSGSSASFAAIGGGGDGWYGGGAGSISVDNITGSAPGGGGSSYIAPGLDGYTNSIKSTFDDAFNYLGAVYDGNADVVRPGIQGNGGYIVVEWFETYSAGTWEYDTQVYRKNSYVSTNMAFGSFLAFDGATLVVSAPQDRRTVTGSSLSYYTGSVTVFEFDGFEWQEITTLRQFGTNSVRQDNGFGQSLDVQGDFIMVGAPAHRYDENGLEPLVNAGIVYAYQKVNGVWKNMQRVGPPGNNTNAGDKTGKSVATYGDWVFIGAPAHEYSSDQTDRQTNAGAFYLWKWINGTLTFQRKETAPRTERKAGGQFGWAMTNIGSDILVSAPGTVTSGNMSADGKVFVYGLSNDDWVLKQTIEVPFSTYTNGSFGYSIASDGDILAVGAPEAEIGTLWVGPNSGVAYTPKEDSKFIDAKTANFTLEIGIFAPVTGTRHYLNSKNYTGVMANGQFNMNWSAGNLRFNFGSFNYVVPNNIAAANRWHNVAIRKTAGDSFYRIFINGTYWTSVTIAEQSSLADFKNGFTVRTDLSGQTTETVIDYIRISDTALSDAELALNAQDEIGPRPSSFFFAPYRRDIEDWLGLYEVETSSTTEDDPVVYLAPSITTESPARAGQVYLFENNNGSWNFTQAIYPTDTMTLGDRFGHAIDVVGDFLIVGAPNHANDQNNLNPQLNAGASWFFQNVDGAWIQQQKIVAWGHEMVAGDANGSTLAAYETTIAVASPNHPYDENGDNYLVGAGAVYIWEFIEGAWQIKQKLTAKTRVANGNFGFSLAMSDKLLVVGSPDPTGTTGGRATVFEKTDTQIKPWVGYSLVPMGTNVSNAGDRFGYSVAINSANEVVVSAPYHAYDAAGVNPLTNAGAVFVFKKTTSWGMAQKIVAGNKHKDTVSSVSRANGELFGFSLASEGNQLLVGIPRRLTDATGLNSLTDAGAVLAFARADADSDYAQIQILTSKMKSAQPSEFAGYAVSGFGDYLVVGAPRNHYNVSGDGYMNNAGSVYVWHNNGTEWKMIQKVVAVDSNGITRQPEALFGASLVLWEDTLIVGAPYTSTISGQTENGALFVYKLVDGKFVFDQAIVPNLTPYQNSNVRFGMSVDFDGTTLIVGAPYGRQLNNQSYLSGRVWFFDLTEEGKFAETTSIADNTEQYTYSVGFGSSVSVRDGLAIAGNNTALSSSTYGQAMIMQKIDGVWQQTDRIENQRPSTDYGMNFGYAIVFSADNTKMFVSARNHDYNRLNRYVPEGGAVYFYTMEEGGWKFKQKITPIGDKFHNPSDTFGYTLAFNDDTNSLFVTSQNYKFNAAGVSQGSNYGAVFEFSLNEELGLYETKERILPDAAYHMSAGSEFGYSVVVKGNLLLVSAPGDAYGNEPTESVLTGAGSILMFRHNGTSWFFVKKLLPEGPNGRIAGLRFGETMNYDPINGNLVVGTYRFPYDEHGENSQDNAGAVFVYKFESLDTLRADVVGGKYISRATTEIVFDAETGTFDSVEVTSGGVGYRDTPAVNFSVAGFEAHALMVETSLANPTLTAIGSGTPTVTVVNDPLDTTGSGAQVSLTRAGNRLDAVNIEEHGAGYTDAPAVSLSGGRNVTLRAVLEPTSLESVQLVNGGAGFTSFPTALIDAPSAGGVTAQTAITMQVDGVLVPEGTKSYIGEKFVIDMGDLETHFEVLTTDAQGNIKTVSLINTPTFTRIPSFYNLPVDRPLETESFGAITSPTEGEDANEDYGLVTDAVTSSEDYGLVTEGVSDSEDYMIDAGAISYGSITEPVTEYVSYGPFSALDLTVAITARIRSFTLTEPGSGYTRRPAVSFGGAAATAATATATLVPTGVDRIEVVNPGYDVPMNASVTITGAHTTRATATVSVVAGGVNGLKLDAAGSRYTRTPKLVFSTEGFSGNIELTPTTLASVVTTKSDQTLTQQGRVNFAKRLVSEQSKRIENTKLGTSLAASGSTVAVGGTAWGTTDTANISASGYINIYEVAETEDKLNKAYVDGWLNASSALKGLSDYTLSAWFRSTPTQLAKSNGTIFSAMDPNRPGFLSAIVSDGSGSFTVPEGIDSLYVQGWGSGSKSGSPREGFGGYVGGEIAVTAGDEISYFQDNVTGRTFINKNGVQIANVGSGFNSLIEGLPTSPLTPTTFNPIVTLMPWDHTSETKSGMAIRAGRGISLLYDFEDNLIIAGSDGGRGSYEGGFYPGSTMVGGSTGYNGRMVQFDFSNSATQNGSSNISNATSKKSIYTGSNFIRVVDSFTNVSNAPVTLSAMTQHYQSTKAYVGSTIHPSSKQVVNYTSSASDPVTHLTVVQGDTAGTSELVVTQNLISGAAKTQNWTITLQPGETKTYAHFYFVRTKSGNTIKNSHENAAETFAKPNWSVLLAGLTQNEINTIKNFDIATYGNIQTIASDEFTTVVDAPYTQTSGQFNDGSYGVPGGVGLVTMSTTVTSEANKQFMQITSRGQVNMGSNNGQIVAGYVSALDSNWHNATYVVDNGTAKAYVDGLFVGSASVNDLGANDIVALGAKFNRLNTEATEDKFNGYLADVIVWNTALTDEEVQQVQNGEVVQSGAIRAHWLKN